MRIKIDADLALGFSKAELTELSKLGKTNQSTQYRVVPISFTRRTRKNQSVPLGTELTKQCLWVSVKYWVDVARIIISLASY